MGSHELNNHHRAIQAAQGIDPDTPEATRAREIAMFGAQETGGAPLPMTYEAIFKQSLDRRGRVVRPEDMARPQAQSANP